MVGVTHPGTPQPPLPPASPRLPRSSPAWDHASLPGVPELVHDPGPCSALEQRLASDFGVVGNACSAEAVAGCSRHFSSTAWPVPEGHGQPGSRPRRGVTGPGMASGPPPQGQSTQRRVLGEAHWFSSPAVCLGWGRGRCS